MGAQTYDLLVSYLDALASTGLYCDTFERKAISMLVPVAILFCSTLFLGLKLSNFLQFLLYFRFRAFKVVIRGAPTEDRFNELHVSLNSLGVQSTTMIILSPAGSEDHSLNFRNDVKQTEVFVNILW